MLNVKINRAYKYRIYPNKSQQEALAKLFGCVRYVWNWALDLRESYYKDTGKALLASEISKGLTDLRKSQDTLWLSDVSRISLTQSLRNQYTAYDRFFKRISGKPRPKSKHAKQSAYFRHNDIKLSHRGIKLQKVDSEMRVNFHRPLPKDCEIRSVTVSKDKTGKYYVSISVIETIAQLEPISAKIGIDLGLTNFAVTSNGNKSIDIRILKKKNKRKRRAQRVLSRRKRGSKNYHKARVKLAKFEAKDANIRKDFQHKLSKRLIDENQAIGIESLRIKNMMKNKRFAKSIGDVAWGQFKAMLQYKAEWYGRDVVPLDSFYPSSKICSACGHKVDELPLRIRQWTCPECFTEHDRDVNAAINVRNNTVGMTEIDACGVTVRPAITEARHREARNILVA
ncbi:MAG: IS200/IS605 family element transposase accessory protein TnpB [Gemmatimonadetes bacterium]|nr:IS200/IS605 family element transposase accessory protein TnpB [Gemmatimonadota bacterium]